MSAFQCSDRHLTALAAYAVRNDLSGINEGPGGVRAMIREVFGVLARENAESLDARYPGDKGADLGAVDPRAMVETFEPIAIIKACHCYAYQACEHTGWESSRAKQIVERIESHAVRHLPGYAEAPWGL